MGRHWIVKPGKSGGGRGVQVPSYGGIERKGFGFFSGDVQLKMWKNLCIHKELMLI